MLSHQWYLWGQICFFLLGCTEHLTHYPYSVHYVQIFAGSFLGCYLLQITGIGIILPPTLYVIPYNISFSGQK